MFDKICRNIYQNFDVVYFSRKEKRKCLSGVCERRKESFYDGEKSFLVDSFSDVFLSVISFTSFS